MMAHRSFIVGSVRFILGGKATKVDILLQAL